MFHLLSGQFKSGITKPLLAPK